MDVRRSNLLKQLLVFLQSCKSVYFTRYICFALVHLVDMPRFFLHDITKNSVFQYFNQILTAVLELLDASDPSIYEMVLSLIVEMLKNQVCYLCYFP